MVPGEPGPPLKVCFFNRSYAPDLGATGQLLTELAEDLVREYRCEVTVIAGAPSRSGRRNGVRVIRAGGTSFPSRRFAARASNYVTYFLCASLAGLCLRKQDVVVFMTDPPIIGLSALLAARRAGAKLVFLCEDIFPEVARLLEDFRSPTLDRILDRVGRFLIRKSDRVVAVGETMRQRLIALKGADPSKSRVIHNWADCDAIRPGDKRNPFSTAHGLAGRFVVMHAGNLGLSQNLDALLGAAGRLREHPDILFALVGDGVRRAALEAQARTQGLDNVRFFSYQSRETLSQVYASADLFVVSLKRGLAGCIVPSKLYGILAAGRPFVAAVEDSCEAAAIARQHQCGLLAEPGDPAGLARGILALRDDPTLRERMGCSAREAALRFDRKQAARSYYKLFQELT